MAKQQPWACPRRTLTPWYTGAESRRENLFPKAVWCSMNDEREERAVSLKRSSWDLLDAAAQLWDGSADEILDSVVQGFLATDDGRTLAHTESLARLKKLFGENRG